MTDPRSYQARPDLLKDRVVLVTGAGRGIGRAAALAFARHGGTAILHGRKVKPLEALYDEIVAAGGPQPAILPLDFEAAGEKDFAGLAEVIAGQLGRLDGILHNAVAPFTPAPLEHETLEHWNRALRVNLAAPVALTRACLPLLRAAPDAAVVVTSDTHGHAPHAYWGSLAASKCAAEAWVKMQAEEWDGSPALRINAVIPGAVDSPQRARSHPGEARSARRRPEALLPVYLYLMGPDSRGVSGRVFDCG